MLQPKQKKKKKKETKRERRNAPQLSAQSKRVHNVCSVKKFSTQSKHLVIARTISLYCGWTTTIEISSTLLFFKKFNIC